MAGGERRGCVRAGDAYNPRMELAAEVRAFIERQRVAHLATSEADGTPHLVPICFALVDGLVYSVIDDKPKRTVLLRRVQNIAERPGVALLFDHYEEDWGRLGWVQLRGRASLLAIGAEHDRAIEALRARYPQYRALDGDERVVIRIEPGVTRRWGALGAGSAGARPTSAAAARVAAGVLPADVPEDEARGLNLVRQVVRIAGAHVATEFRAGVASGHLARLHSSAQRGAASAQRVAVEPDDEVPTADEGGRMLRYALDGLADGVYVAESTGPANAVTVTYFELAGGSVGRLFPNERRALAALRHGAG